MNISLNLIPEQFKHELQRMRLLRLAQRLAAATSVLLITAAIILVSIRFFMESQYKRIASQTALVSVENKKLEDAVATLNESVTRADKIQSESRAWGPFLVHMTQAIPSGIRLTAYNLTLDGESVISGVAATRDDLLHLQEQLRGLPGVSDVRLPPQSLLSKEQVSFSITFTISL